MKRALVCVGGGVCVSVCVPASPGSKGSVGSGEGLRQHRDCWDAAEAEGSDSPVPRAKVGITQGRELDAARLRGHWLVVGAEALECRVSSAWNSQQSTGHAFPTRVGHEASLAGVGQEDQAPAAGTESPRTEFHFTMARK